MHFFLWLSFTQNAAQTVSAARQTSRRASAVFVCGVKRRGPGCWGITASPTVPGVTTAGTAPASVRTCCILFDFSQSECKAFTAGWTHCMSSISFLRLTFIVGIGPVLCYFATMLHYFTVCTSFVYTKQLLGF